MDRAPAVTAEPTIGTSGSRHSVEPRLSLERLTPPSWDPLVGGGSAGRSEGVTATGGGGGVDRHSTSTLDLETALMAEGGGSGGGSGTVSGPLLGRRQSHRAGYVRCVLWTWGLHGGSALRAACMGACMRGLHGGHAWGHVWVSTWGPHGQHP